MKTNRRTFIKTTGLSAAFLAATGLQKVKGEEVRAEDWSDYFPNPPKVYDRLDQGMFETVVPEDRFGKTIMLTSPTDEYVSNPGMGYQVYAYEEKGTPDVPGQTEAESIEKLVKLPFSDVVYMRTDWRIIQQRLGRLDLPEMWKYAVKLAKENGKRISFRIQLGNPGPVCAVPQFVLDKSNGVVDIGHGQLLLPHYDHPEFKNYFKELNRMLADIYDEDPAVECVDFAGYGSWGEWHSPQGISSFPDSLTASETLSWMIEEQLDAWNYTPLVMGAHGGASYIRLKDVIATAMKGGCWWRRDNVGLAIKPSDVYMLNNHPGWQANVIEDGRFRDYRMSDPDKVENIPGQHIRDYLMMKAPDLKANYWALWQNADNILKYREKYKRGFEVLDRQLGYRVRPSWVWLDTSKEPYSILLGIKNDGCANPPGILRIHLSDEKISFKVGGGLDPGIPGPGEVRVCRIQLPYHLKSEMNQIDHDAASALADLNLRLSAELEFYGRKYPVKWACTEPLNEDGSLSIHPTLGLNLR